MLRIWSHLSVMCQVILDRSSGNKRWAVSCPLPSCWLCTLHFLRLLLTGFPHHYRCENLRTLIIVWIDLIYLDGIQWDMLELWEVLNQISILFRHMETALSATWSALPRLPWLSPCQRPRFLPLHDFHHFDNFSHWSSLSAHDSFDCSFDIF